MSTLNLSQVDVEKLTPAQRMLVAQQQDFIKLGLRDQANLGRHNKRTFKYLHRSSLTIANLQDEFGVEPDYLVDQFNLVLWPDQWVKECRPRPWYYLIVEKSRDVDPVDALMDEGYEGTTRIVIKNLPPEVRGPDLEAWLRFGIMSEDPDYKAARRAVMVTQNKIDAVEQKLQKLPFRRTEARTEEEAQEEREVMRRTLAQNRQEWEDELEGYRQELAEMDDRIRKLRIVCSPGPVDILHRTVTWYATFPGKEGRNAATLAVRKPDWYGVTLARGLSMTPEEVYELAFTIYAARMRKTVTREVVKEAGLSSDLSPDELAKRIGRRLRYYWDGLAQEKKSEYEEVAEQEAAAQAVPKAQDGPIPEERKQSAVRMTGVRVERVREGVGRMLYEDGELYEGAWFGDLPHGHGVVFGHDGLYRGAFVQGRRAGQGTMVCATGERVTGTFGYRATTSVEEAQARGKGLVDPPRVAEGEELEKRHRRLQRLLREYYQDEVRERAAKVAGGSGAYGGGATDEGADSAARAAERAKALQVEEGEEEEEELLGHLVTEDKLAKDAERTATEVAAATAGGGGGGDGAEEGARIARRHSSVPSLDLSAVVNARPPAGKDEEDVASKMAKLSLSARRELALKEAPEGLSLMEGSDAFADGVPQGECTVHFPDGSKYVGQLADGIISGHGVYESCTGTVFKGHFVNGVLSGRGIMREADGRIVDGHWEEGMPSGICSEFLPNGDVYEGGYEFGLRSGRGILKKANGDLVTGFWMDGRLHGRADVLYGNVRVKDDGFSKRRRLVSDYGYVGRWVNGKPRGRGAHFSRYPDGSVSYSFATQYGGQYPRLDKVEEEEQRLWRRTRRTWLKRAEEEYARRKRGVRKCLKKYREAWEARNRGEELDEEVDLGPQERPALNRSGHQDYDLSAVQ